MLELFGQTLPQLVGLIIAPTTIVVTVIMLSTAHGMRNVLFMMIGGFISLMGLAYFAYFLGASASAGGGPPVWQAYFDLAAGLVFAVLGVLQIRAARRPKQGDPAWLATLDKFGWLQSAAVGLYLGALNPKGLALMLHVGETAGASGLPVFESAGFLIVFSVLALTGMVVPLLIAILAGERGKAILTGLRSFMSKHNNAIMIVLFTVLTAVFLGSAFQALAAQ